MSSCSPSRGSDPRRGRSVAPLFAAAVAALVGSPFAAASPQEGSTGETAAPPPVPPLAQSPPPVDPATAPWRLSKALETPEWFEIGGSVRARFEHLDERFRGNLSGHSQVFVLRSLVAMTLRDEFLEVTGELQDSRAYGFPDDSILNSTIVNSVELLQGYVAGRFTDTFAPGDVLRVQLGRHTMDSGSRRMVARNRFRNTINTFLGLNTQWDSGDTFVRAFYTHPTIRLPSALQQGEIQDNVVEFDEERSNNRFWGVFGAQKGLALSSTLEAYYYGLERSDVLGLRVADREIHTIGSRWFRPHAPDDLFWEFEAAYQFGTSRSGSTSLQDLEHDAYFVHASMGYRWDADWQPRLEVLFDVASGDEDPNDLSNNRFDTLFGARRWEFGPTGIFGAIGRRNILTPGLRFVSKPAQDWELMITHRFHYLESDRDAWVDGLLRDPTGAAGSNIGSLSEFRARYDGIAPKNLRLEFGAAYLAAGSFVEEVGDGEDSLYTYVQTNFSF